MVSKTGFAVTIKAGHSIVGRDSPGFNILLHVVAEATKGWAFRESKKGYKKDEQKQ